MASVTTYAALNASGSGIADGNQAITAYVYDAAGLLRQTLRQNSGNAATQTSYGYDGLGRLISTLDPNGLSTVAYDAANNRIVTTHANGLVETAIYDGAGRLVSLFSPEPGSGEQATTTYKYDADGRLRMTQLPDGLCSYILYDADGRKSADIDGDGSVTRYRYDADGRLIHTARYVNQIDVGQLLNSDGSPSDVQLDDLVVDNLDNEPLSSNHYDEAGRLDSTVDALDYVTRYFYDGASRLISTMRFQDPVPLENADPTAASARVDSIFYDKDGLVIGTVDADYEVASFAYDAAGKLIQTTRFGKIWSLDSSSYNFGDISFDDVMEQIDSDPVRDPSSDIHEYNFYDAEGRVTGAVDGENYYTQTTYDRNGNVASIRRYLERAVKADDGAFVLPTPNSGDQVTTYGYNQLGQLVSEIGSDGTLTTHSYDANGKLVSTTTAAGTAESRTKTVRYDAHGRLTAELSGVGASLITSSMTPTQINDIWDQYSTKYAYDGAGLLTSSTDADGNRTIYFYTDDGSLVATVNARGEVEQYEYDALNRKTFTTHFANRLTSVALAGLAPGIVDDSFYDAISGIEDDDNDSWQYSEYDVRGELIHSEGSDGQREMTYTASGQVAIEIDTIREPNGGDRHLKTIYSYDDRDRVTNIQYTNGGVFDPFETGNQDFGTVYKSYDGFGNLVFTNETGASVTREYDKLGRAIATGSFVTTNTTTTEYDALNRVVSTTDQFGQVTSYAYDVAQRKMTVTTPEGIVHSVLANRHGETYQMIDGDGKATTFNYDADGHLTQVSDTLGVQSIDSYDNAGMQITHTDADGKLTVFYYDAASRLFGKTVDVGGLNETTLYSYDTHGRVLSVTGPDGKRTETEYDDAGHVTATIVDADGLRLTTTFVNDSKGNVVEKTDPTGFVTSYESDELGRRTSESFVAGDLVYTTTYAYSSDDVNAVLTSKKDANGNTTRYFYDDDNRLTDEVDALGDRTHYVYDDTGRLASTVSYANPVSISAIEDYLGSSPMAALKAGGQWLDDLSRPDAQHDNVVNNIYDDDGRLLYTVDGTGAVTRRDYDNNGHVVKLTVFHTVIPLTTPMTQDAVDAATAAIADQAQDVVSASVYDVRGRVIERSNGGRGLTTYAYDGNGNLTCTTSYAERGGPAVAQQRIVYDANNRVTATATAQSMNEQGQVLSWSITRQDYDAAGNVTRRVAYANTLTSNGLPANASQADVAAWAATVTTDPTHDSDLRMVYDSANRLVATATAQHVDADGVLQWSVVGYILDGNGNVTQRRAYSHFLSSALLDGATSDTAIADWIGKVVTDNASDSVTTMVYDAGNRLASTTDALGLVTTYNYDGVGNLRFQNVGSRQTSYWYDAANRLVSTIDPQYLDEERRYDAAGNLVEVNNGGRVQRYTYDAAGRQRYAFDAMGCVTETDYDGTGAVGKTILYADPVQVDTLDQIDTLDKVAQLLASQQATPLNRVTSFTYDAAGNRTSTTDAMQFTESYEYDGLGRKNGFVDKSGQRWSYVYDAAGRQVVETSPTVAVADGNGNTFLQSLVTRITYDALGRVSSKTEGDSSGIASRTTGYEYDLAGRQTVTVLQKVPVYDAANDPLSVAANASPVETTPAENPRITVIYDALGNAVSNTDAAGNVTRKVYDQRGREIAEIDALGYVTRSDRDVYGNVIRTTRTAQSIFPLIEQSQVVQLYAALLGRAPDQAGDTFWVQDLRNGASFAAVADGILKSVEAQNLYAPSQDAAGFVRQLFQVALGRAPSADEQARYVGMLDAPGTTRGAMVDAMLHDIGDPADLKVWHAKTDGLVPGSTTAARRHVTEIYQAMFGRAPTSSEMNSGLAVLQIGTDTDLVNTLLASQEGSQLYSPYDDNATFATTLSNTMLGRDPGADLDSLMYDTEWNSRATAILNLIASIDARNDGESSLFRLTVTDEMVLAPIADFSAGGLGADSLAEVWNGLDHSSDRTITMAYDDLNRMTSKTEGVGLTYGLSNYEYSYNILSAQKRTEYQYDGFGELVLQRVTGLAANTNDGETDSELTAYRYNARGEQDARFVMQATSGAAAAEYESSLKDGYLQWQGADAFGLGDNSGGYLTLMSYDAAGNLVGQFDYSTLIPAGGFGSPDSIDFGYQIIPNIQVSDDDRQTSYGYDLDNRKVSETQVNALVGAVDATSAVQARGDVQTLFRWDKLGNLEETDDALGGATFTYYDALGRTSAVATKIDTRFALTTFGHDIFGNIVRTTGHANGAFDVSVDGYTAGVADDQRDRVTVATFDLNGHATKVVDADHQTSYTSYDVLGRVAKSWKNLTTAVSSSPWAQQVRTIFSVNRYDAVGNIIEVISPSTSSTMDAGSPVKAEVTRSEMSYDPDAGSYIYNGDNTISLSVSVTPAPSGRK